MGFTVFRMLSIIVPIALLADVALAQIDGAPGNHVRRQGTTINIIVPVDVWVSRSIYGETDPRKKRRLKKAVAARIDAGVKRFRETVQKPLDEEPPYRGCYRFQIQSRWQTRFYDDGSYTPNHVMMIGTMRHPSTPTPSGDPYRRSLLGKWGTDLSDAVDPSVILQHLVGVSRPPSARVLGDRINALYKQKTGKDLPGCYVLIRPWTEQGTTAVGGKLDGHGRLTLTVAPWGSGDRYGTLKGWGRVRAEARTDAGWHEQWHGTFTVTGTLDGDYLRLTFEDWDVFHRSKPPSQGYSHRRIRIERLSTITVGPLVDGTYKGEETVNGFARGDASFAVPAPNIQVLTTIHTEVQKRGSPGNARVLPQTPSGLQ